MALRTLWTGNLRIGQVAIPVKLYSATREAREGGGFKQLHKSCLQPISQWRVCEPCKAAPVPWEDVVKGREVSKGQFVAFTDEELAALEPKEEQNGALPSIQALHSVLAKEVPLEYADTTYWMAPELAGKKAFLAFWLAMSLSEQDLFCRISMRGRSKLCVVHASEGSGALFTVTTVRFATEIVDPAELSPAASVELPNASSSEVRLARKLVREIEDTLDFRHHVDNYGRELAKKVEEKAVEKAGVSLEDLLRQSVEAARETP